MDRLNPLAANEFMSEDEIRELTGSCRLKEQLNWLQENKWKFAVNTKNRIIISRFYCRIHLSGNTQITLEDKQKNSMGNQPNFELLAK